MPIGGFQKAFGTGEFIRDYLDEHGEAYVWEIFVNLKGRRRENREKAPSYESFRSYLWKCKELDLVEFVREEDSDWGEKKRFYRLVEGNKDDVAWRNPAKYYRERVTGTLT